MECDFMVFHTNYCLTHYGLKSMDKLIYIRLLHTLNERCFINDNLLYSSLANLFCISVRSVYRSIHNLLKYKLIEKSGDKYFLIHDYRFDYD